jgi:hypothetical protein
MPLTNIYLPPNITEPDADRVVHLREQIASLLSVDGREVPLKAVRVRFVPITAASQTEGELDVEVSGFDLPTRVEQKDEMAGKISAFVTEAFEGRIQAHTWLLLGVIGITLETERS